MLDQHIDRENNGDMSVSDLDEVLRMESFFWDWAFKCLPLLRGPIWGILGLERRHEIWLLYVPPIDEYGYRSKIVRPIKMFLSFSALNCHRRRKNQYPNDLDMDERCAPSPGTSYGKPGG